MAPAAIPLFNGNNAAVPTVIEQPNVERRSWERSSELDGRERGIKHPDDTAVQAGNCRVKRIEVFPWCEKRHIWTSENEDPSKEASGGRIDDGQ